MKVPDNYLGRAAATAESIPREVIAGLLERMLPRVPVKRRAVEPTAPAPAPAPSPDRIAVPSSMSSGGTRLSRSDKRPPKARLVRMGIESTFKGRRKAMNLPTSDLLHTILGASTVGEAIRNGAKLGDVLYAWRTGYLEIIVD